MIRIVRVELRAPKDPRWGSVEQSPETIALC
jgi:hypothetical protein